LVVLSEALSPALSKTLKSEKSRKNSEKRGPDGLISVLPFWREEAEFRLLPCVGYGRTLKFQTLGWLPAVFWFWSSWLPARSFALVVIVAM
jgi:hypothetical protein